MDVFASLGLASQTAEYALARAMGVTFTYSNRSAAFVTLLGRTMSANLYRDFVQTLPSDLTVRVYRVAKQTNFPPTLGVTTGDLVRYLGYEWRVDKMVDLAGYGTVFDLICVRTKPLKVM